MLLTSFSDAISTNNSRRFRFHLLHAVSLIFLITFHFITPLINNHFYHSFYHFKKMIKASFVWLLKCLPKTVYMCGYFLTIRRLYHLLQVSKNFYIFKFRRVANLKLLLPKTKAKFPEA